MNSRGSVTPLIATYLSLILLTALGFLSVATATLAGHRIQGVSDYAVLYAHDRSVRAGKPQEAALKTYAGQFLSSASSARRLEINSSRAWVVGEVSHLQICARYRNLFDIGLSSMVVCRESAAKSFLIL